MAVAKERGWAYLMIIGLPLLGSPLMYSLTHIPMGRRGALDCSHMSSDVVKNKVDLTIEPPP